MLIAVIADTHLPRGKRRLPDSCLERLRGADLVMHAGDFSAASVLRDLDEIGSPVVAVHGNVDDVELKRLLPERRVVDVDGVSIGMVHDAGASRGRLERLRAAFPDADAVVFGHSHLPLHEAAEGFQIFNPGSPTQRRRARVHTMGMARVEDRQVSFELVELGE